MSSACLSSSLVPRPRRLTPRDSTRLRPSDCDGADSTERSYWTPDDPHSRLSPLPPIPTTEYEGSAALGSLRDLVSCQNGTIRSPFIPSISLTQGSLSLPSRPFLLLPLQEILPREHVCSKIVIKRRFLNFDHSKLFRNRDRRIRIIFRQFS